MAKTETLEDSFKKLDEIVAGLENTELSMDAALKLYKEGIKLVESCNSKIDKVEKEIIVLNG